MKYYSKKCKRLAGIEPFIKDTKIKGNEFHFTTVENNIVKNNICSLTKEKIENIEDALKRQYTVIINSMGKDNQEERIMLLKSLIPEFICLLSAIVSILITKNAGVFFWGSSLTGLLCATDLVIKNGILASHYLDNMRICINNMSQLEKVLEDSIDIEKEYSKEICHLFEQEKKLVKRGLIDKPVNIRFLNNLSASALEKLTRRLKNGHAIYNEPELVMRDTIDLGIPFQIEEKEQDIEKKSIQETNLEYQMPTRSAMTKNQKVYTREEILQKMKEAQKQETTTRQSIAPINHQYDSEIVKTKKRVRK